MSAISKRPYFFALVALYLLFILRVLGQILVALFHPPFLPAMNEWYSGLVPYPILLVCQVGIIYLFGKICMDFAGLGGHFSVPDKKLAILLTRCGTLYFSAMLIRYALLIGTHPQALWVTGCIPTAFHMVLASYILVLSDYHHKASEALSRLSGQLASAGAAFSKVKELQNA